MRRSGMIRWWAAASLMMAVGCGEGGTERHDAVVNLSAWPMHAIESRLRGANALGSGDVNGDGYMDYVTNYEFDQRYVVHLHPGDADAVRRPWPRVVAFLHHAPSDQIPPIGTDTEHAALADLDGDGNFDIVGAQGTHVTGFWEGQAPGVRIIWGPPAAEASNENAWVDAGRIPQTIERGHFLYVLPHDVNGDGAIDILTGGRLQWDTQARAATKWIEAPLDRAHRRDLSRWTVHDIDPQQWDGHGFVLTDIDEDGDLDIADANADFDTPEEEETVHWYENPGPDDPRQREPWPRHEIYRGSEFYAKPQLALADLDGDGHEDLITQVDREIYWFRKTGIAPVTWQRIVIPKDPVAYGPSRPIRVADLDGNGRLDLFAMMTHDDGVIPSDRASAIWMEYRGPAPQADNWITHVVKWGSGKPMQIFTFGEKWDQVQFDDLDRDGDLDILANCEEWWVDQREFTFWWDRQLNPVAVSVVWFENRLREAPYSCVERDGLCVLEAEHYTDLLDGTWTKRSHYEGYAGEGYMEDHNAVVLAPRSASETRGVSYAVNVTGGAYVLWVRRRVPASWGPIGLGGPASNSAHVIVDDRPTAAVFDELDAGFDTWTWVRSADPIDLTAGEHRVIFRVREGGYAIDRIVLSREAGFMPENLGPDETRP